MAKKFFVQLEVVGAFNHSRTYFISGLVNRTPFDTIEYAQDYRDRQQQNIKGLNYLVIFDEYDSSEFQIPSEVLKSHILHWTIVSRDV